MIGYYFIFIWKINIYKYKEDKSIKKSKHGCMVCCRDNTKVSISESEKITFLKEYCVAWKY